MFSSIGLENREISCCFPCSQGIRTSERRGGGGCCRSHLPRRITFTSPSRARSAARSATNTPSPLPAPSSRAASLWRSSFVVGCSQRRTIAHRARALATVAAVSVAAKRSVKFFGKLLNAHSYYFSPAVRQQGSRLASSSAQPIWGIVPGVLDRYTIVSQISGAKKRPLGFLVSAAFFV